MTDLLEVIYEKLSEVGAAYFEQAPQDATLPYIVFTIPSTSEDFQRELLFLEVRCYDDDTDTTELERMANDVKSTLHRYKHYDADRLSTVIYFMSRNIIEEDYHRRRDLRFVCKTYFYEED